MTDDDRTSTDERWRLLRKLDDAFWDDTDASEQERRWDPVRVMSSEAHALNSPVRQQAVHIVFDYRMSQSELLREIARQWSQWRREQWVVKSQRFDLKRRLIVELVCLELPNADWAARMEVWNRRYPQRSEWHYQHPSRLKRDFERAELRLTGKEGGLAWYYDPNEKQRRTDVYRFLRDRDREDQERAEELVQALIEMGQLEFAALCRGLITRAYPGIVRGARGE